MKLSPALAAAAALFCGCAKGHSAADAGSCALRVAPVASPGAPARLGLPEELPLPIGATSSQSPQVVLAGSAVVALFQTDAGVAAATSAGQPLQSAFLLAPRATSPALAALGARIFTGWIAAGAIALGVSDNTQGLQDLAGGHGRTVPLALPSGATSPAQLAVAAAGTDLVAAFTATMPGQRTQVFAARLRGADCTGCTLAFDSAVPVGQGTFAEALPQVALSAGGAVAVSFLRSGGELWIAQGTLGGGALSLQSARIATGAPWQPAPLGYFADGALAVAYGSAADALPDGGPNDAGPSDGGAARLDLVVRRVVSGISQPAVRANDDDPALAALHTQPGMAIDATGRLYVAWYDTRFAPDACAAAVMLARSTDQGRSFSPNALVTPDGETVPFDAGVPAALDAGIPAAPVSVQIAGSRLYVGFTGTSGTAARAELSAGTPP